MASKKKTARRKTKSTPTGSELLVLSLQRIYSAENHLSQNLPKLSKAIESQRLQALARERLTEGERIISEVELALNDLDESPERKRNFAAEGLIADAREHVQTFTGGPALDSLLLASFQKTEHYCIAAWGTAKALASATGQKISVKAMNRALKEGGKFDARLTKLADKKLTPALLALAETEDTDSGEEVTEKAPIYRSSRRAGGEVRP